MSNDNFVVTVNIIWSTIIKIRLYNAVKICRGHFRPIMDYILGDPFVIIAESCHGSVWKSIMWKNAQFMWDHCELKSHLCFWRPWNMLWRAQVTIICIQ